MDDPETILRPLANYLRPMLQNSWKERRRALLTENADNIKRLLDNLQKKVGEVRRVVMVLLCVFSVTSPYEFIL